MFWMLEQTIFHALTLYRTSRLSQAVSYTHLINGNVVQQLIYYDTGESGSGYDKTFVSSDLFTINTANGNYYLILEVDSGATHLGKNATIEMNGCYLI